MPNTFQASWEPLQDHKLECPVCHERLLVKVKVVVRRASVQLAGGTSFRTNVSTSLESQAVQVDIKHQCNIPEKKD